MRRRREQRLLRQAAGLLVLAAVGVAGARWEAQQAAGTVAEVAWLAGWIGLLGLVHHLFCRLRVRGDESLWPIVGLLGGLGLLFRLRLADPLLHWSDWRSLAPFPVAVATLVLTVALLRGRLRWLERGAWLGGVAAVLVLALVLRHGQHFRGALYGPGRTTPTELLKPLLVIFLAGFLRRRRTRPALWGLAIVWLLISLLLARQGDLGMIAILNGLLLGMFYLATGRVRYPLLGLVAVVALGPLLYYAMPWSPVAARGGQRVAIWLNPWSEPLGRGYQSVQALFAIRAGGWDGMGLGDGQAQLTPLTGSDFIWSLVAEEMGLLGSALLLLLYFALFQRGYRIAALAEQRFPQLLAAGCVVVLAIQTVVNLGGVVRGLPITGITLPLLSYGGSSLVITHFLIGLLFAVGDDLEGAGAAPPARLPGGGADP